MSLNVIGCSARGSSHILKDLPCQDNWWQRTIIDGSAVAVAVADGHGSQSCPYSDKGSEIAAKVFCDHMYQLYHGYEGDTQTLSSYLHREGNMAVVQSIVRDWRDQVRQYHEDEKREIPVIDTENGTDIDSQALYRLYGTTLVGLMVTQDFHFALQIGDGDITVVSAEGETDSFLESDQILGVETHSICDRSPWKYSHSAVRHINEDELFSYVITTDGFKNSHATQKDYEASCVGYVDVLKQNGSFTLRNNLSDWLSETSSQGCGDDITMIIVSNFSEPVQDEDDNKVDEAQDQPVVVNPAREFQIRQFKDTKTGRIENFGGVYDTINGQLISRVDSLPGANDMCPCGSGLKYKKCCRK